MGKEVKSMNNVKVRTKLIIVMLAAFLAMTACVVFSTESKGDADKGTGNDRVR